MLKLIDYCSDTRNTRDFTPWDRLFLLEGPRFGCFRQRIHQGAISFPATNEDRPLDSIGLGKEEFGYSSEQHFWGRTTPTAHEGILSYHSH